MKKLYISVLSIVIAMLFPFAAYADVAPPIELGGAGISVPVLVICIIAAIIIAVTALITVKFLKKRKKSKTDEEE